MEEYLRNVKNISTTMDKGPVSWKGRTLLHFAVMLHKNSSKMINACMKRGFGEQIHMQDCSNLTPIHLAFRLNKHDVVKILVDHCKNYSGNLFDNEGLSYLHIACALKKHYFLQKIFRKENDIDVVYRGKTSYGWITPGSTALHVAVASGNSVIVETLLKERFDIEAKDDDGQTPLHRFLRLGGYKAQSICRILLSSKAVTNDMIERIGLTRLHMEIFCIEEDIDQFEEVGIDQFINEKDMKALIECRDSSSFLYDYDGCTPLHLAIMRNGSIDSVKKLIKEDSDLLVENQKGNTPLYSVLSRSAEWSAIHDIADVLLNNITLRNRMEEMSGITMLHIACHINLSAALWLLAGPTNVNAQVKLDCPIWPGCTPLHVFLRNIKYHIKNFNPGGYKNDENPHAILKIILEVGANVTITDSNSETPIHLSLVNLNNSISLNYIDNSIHLDEIVKPLVKNHRVYRTNPVENLQAFDVNPVDRNGVSHFHAACLVNDAKLVRLFLENGADVNQSIDFFAKDFAGQTPLHLAVAYETGNKCKRETVQLLLTNGADIKAEDSLGQNAFHKAVQLRCSVDILEMFVKHSKSIINTRDILERTPLGLLLRSENIKLEEIKFFEKYGCRLNSSDPLNEKGYISMLISGDVKLTTESFAAILNAIDPLKPDNVDRRILIHNMITTNNPNCKMFEYEVLIKKLQLAKYDIDFQDIKGKTALHLAAQFGNQVAVRELLNGGANINVLDVANMTPLNYAMQYLDNKKYGSYQKCYGAVVVRLVHHMLKLKQLNLEISQNNNYQSIELSLFKKFDNYSSELNSLYQDLCINYLFKINFMRPVLICKQSNLFVKDFLSEMGKGLISYPFMPDDLRERVDEFFGNYTGDLKDVCMLQYSKAVKRVKLIKSAWKYLLAMALMAGLPLWQEPIPIEIAQMIFQYLKNSDLENFIKGVTRSNIVTVERT